MKHDGFRTLAKKHGERVEIWSRYGTDFTGRFSKIAEAVRGLPAKSALIDGEAVAFLPGGHSDFAALCTKSGGARASFVAFDLLSLEGEDLRQCPIEERRKALAQLVAGNSIQFSASVADDGAIVFDHALPDGFRRDRVEARRQRISKRDKPQLAEVPEP